MHIKQIKQTTYQLHLGLANALFWPSSFSAFYKLVYRLCAVVQHIQRINGCKMTMKLQFINKDASNIGQRIPGEATLVGVRVAAIHKPWEKSREVARLRKTRRNADVTRSKALASTQIQMSYLTKIAILPSTDDPFATTAIPLGSLHHEALRKIRESTLMFLRVSEQSKQEQLAIARHVDLEMGRTLGVESLLHSVLACALQMLSLACSNGSRPRDRFEQMLLFHQAKQFEFIRNSISGGDFGQDVFISIICAADTARLVRDWKASRIHVEALQRWIILRGGYCGLDPKMQVYAGMMDLEISDKLLIRPSLNVLRLPNVGNPLSIDDQAGLVHAQQVTKEFDPLYIMDSTAELQESREVTLACLLADYRQCLKRQSPRVKTIQGSNAFAQASNPCFQVEKGLLMWSSLNLHENLREDVHKLRKSDDIHATYVFEYMRCMCLAMSYSLRSYLDPGPVDKHGDMCIPLHHLYISLQTILPYYATTLRFHVPRLLSPHLRAASLLSTEEDQYMSILWMLSVGAAIEWYSSSISSSRLIPQLWFKTEFRNLRRLLIEAKICTLEPVNLTKHFAPFVFDEDVLGCVLRDLCTEQE